MSPCSIMVLISRLKYMVFSTGLIISKGGLYILMIFTFFQFYSSLVYSSTATLCPRAYIVWLLFSFNICFCKNISCMSRLLICTYVCSCLFNSLNLQMYFYNEFSNSRNSSKRRGLRRYQSYCYPI